MARGGALLRQPRQRRRRHHGPGRRPPAADWQSGRERARLRAPDGDGAVKLFSAVTDRLRETLARTRGAVQDGLDRVFKGQELAPATLEELEEILLQADLGLPTTESFIEAVRDQARRGRLTEGDVRQSLAAHLREALRAAAAPLALEARPTVLLVLGVNGSGKTTTCGKLAAQLRSAGSQVVLAAADTFRAGAIDQLERWGERV